MVYFPEPRAEVYCFRMNFNISKLVYWLERLFVASLVSIQDFSGCEIQNGGDNACPPSWLCKLFYRLSDALLKVYQCFHLFASVKSIDGRTY